MQSTSGLSGRCAVVAVEILLGFEVGVLLGLTHWCIGNVGRGAHGEVVKGACIIILGSGFARNENSKVLDEFLGRALMLVSQEIFNQLT